MLAPAPAPAAAAAFSAAAAASGARAAASEESLAAQSGDNTGSAVEGPCKSTLPLGLAFGLPSLSLADSMSGQSMEARDSELSRTPRKLLLLLPLLLVVVVSVLPAVFVILVARRRVFKNALPFPPPFRVLLFPPLECCLEADRGVQQLAV